MSLTYNVPAFANAGPMSANAEVMEELNRAAAPNQNDFQPAHLLRKQTTDSSLQDKVRFLAEANWGGDCEFWAEELDRQGGLPRENSLDMIDIADGLPDLLDDHKIDPLLLESSAFAWESSVAINGRRPSQQFSAGGHVSENENNCSQELSHNTMNLFSLPNTGTRSKSGSARDSRSRTFQQEEHGDFPNCDKYSVGDNPPMQIVPPKPLTVCSPSQMGYPLKHEFSSGDFSSMFMQEAPDHSPEQVVQHQSFAYDQYAPTYQDYQHQQHHQEQPHHHHLSSTEPTSLPGLMTENQAWGAGETAGFQSQSRPLDMGIAHQETYLMPESNHPYGQMFRTPDARSHGQENHVLPHNYGSSGMSECTNHMYNTCTSETRGTCNMITGQRHDLNLCNPHESLKQTVESLIKPVLGPDMQVGIVIIDNKAGVKSSYHNIQRAAATSADSHSQVSSGPCTVPHQNQSIDLFFDEPYGTSFPRQTAQFPPTTLSDQSANPSGLCNRLIDNTSHKPPVRARIPSSKRMSSDLGQCPPQYVPNGQAVRQHSRSSESVGTQVTQGGSRVPRSHGMSEEISTGAHQCPTKVSRRNTLGEGDPRHQAPGEDNFSIADTSLGAGANTSAPPGDLLPSRSGNDARVATNVSNGSSVEDCLANLLRGFNSNQDLRQLLPSNVPGQVDAVLEAEMRTVDFDLRVARAERKIQEHNEDMQRIDRMIATGQIEKEKGKLLRRRVYNRREAAASRAREDKRLREVVHQKCRLEILERQLRELLVCGASSNVSAGVDGHPSARSGLRNVLSVNDIEGLNTRKCED